MKDKLALATYWHIAYSLAASLCLIAMSACSNPDAGETLLADYLRRVENATGVDAVPHSPSTLLAYPTSRQLNLPIEDLRIGLGDYLELRHCRLFNLISERNSVMGKVMPLSQQLIYEIEFLQEAAICYQKLAGEEKLDEQAGQALMETIQIKKKTLPTVFWNATFASPEMAKTFSLAFDPLALNEQAAYVNSRQALEYLATVGEQLPGDPAKPDVQVLEEQYFTLQLYRYGGRLLESVAQLTAYLNRAAATLESLLQKGPVCYQNKPIKKARILQNVFTKYYAGRVQRYLAQIDQQGRNWLVAIEQLISVQQIELPAAFQDYRRQMLSVDGALWRAFRKATKRHTQAWQELFSQCGLLPQQADIVYGEL